MTRTGRSLNLDGLSDDIKKNLLKQLQAFYPPLAHPQTDVPIHPYRSIENVRVTQVVLVSSSLNTPETFTRVVPV